MTYDSGVYCTRTFSTPIRALALLTITESGSVNFAYQSYYEVTNGTDVSETSSVNHTTLSTGVMVVSPLYIAWQATDLFQFPLAYATELAKQFDIPLRRRG